MPINDFLPFATAVGANVEAQAEYIVDPLVPIGNQAGTTAISALNNKVLRQASVITSQFASYMSDLLAQDVLDNGDTAAIKTQIAALFNAWGGPVDTTLAVTGGVLGVKTGGITNTQVSNTAGITRNKLNISSGSTSTEVFNFNTQSTSLVAITELSASITTVAGAPVVVSLQPIAGGTLPGVIGVNVASYNGTSPPQIATATFVIKKGAFSVASASVQWGMQSTMALGSGNGVGTAIPSSSFSFIDFFTTSPGTYTYSVWAKVTGTGMTVSAFCQCTRLFLKEM